MNLIKLKYNVRSAINVLQLHIICILLFFEIAASHPYYSEQGICSLSKSISLLVED